MRIFSLSFIALLCLDAFSQDFQKPENIFSPNSFLLGKYGGNEVSYYTGTPNIDIPIHSIKIKGVEVPIGIRYDASGIMIDQHPGNVGQNWLLYAGGAIVRSTQGSPDELSDPSSFYKNTGYFYRYSDLAQTQVNTQEELEILANNAMTHGYDYQPDIFSFNFLGYSGRFFLGNDGKWKVDSKDNLLVIQDYTLRTPLFEVNPYNTSKYYPKVLAGFKIVNSNGTIFEFGYDENAIEYSIDFFYQSIPGSQWIANSWHLSRIIDKDGILLYSFDYQRGPFIAQLYRNDNVRRIASNSTTTGYAFPSCQSGSLILQPEDYYIGGSLISPVYLQSIDPLGEEQFSINFSYSPTSEISYNKSDWAGKESEIGSMTAPQFPFFYLQGENPYRLYTNPLEYEKNLVWWKLENIIINQSAGFTKRINFNYNNQSNQRLFLLSVDFVDKTWPFNPNPQKYSYSFEYEKQNLLPGYLSKKIDHWGYYKGEVYSRNFIQHYESRQPDAEYLTVGTLKKIIYPTQGYTSFEFERHDYSKVLNDSKTGLLNEAGIAGGLRIRKIIDFDGINSYEREYKYFSDFANSNTSNTSSGILSYRPKYYWPDWKVYVDNNGYISTETFSINSGLPFTLGLGPNVAYSEVSEIRKDGSYKKFFFTNYGHFHTLFPSVECSFYNTFSPYTMYNNYSVLFGKLQKLEQYSFNDEIMERVENYFRTDAQIHGQYVLSSTAVHSPVCTGANPLLYSGSLYKQFYFDYDIIQESNTRYDNSSLLLENKYLESCDEEMLTANGTTNVRLLKEIIQTSSGKDEITNYSYPSEIDGYMYSSNLQNSFMLYPVEINRYSTDIGDNFPTESGINKITHREINGKIYVDKKFVSHNNAGSLYEAESYDYYDSFGNVCQITSADGVVRTILYGYNNLYPVAEIIGADYNTVTGLVSQEILNSPNSDSELFAELNKLRSSQLLSDCQISTYSYIPYVGVSSFTDSNGFTTRYTYDNFGRLEFVVDNNGKILRKMEYSIMTNN